MSEVTAQLTFIDQIILPLFIIWGVALILSLFREDTEFLWKILFLFIYVFYFFQFLPEITLSLNRLLKSYPYEIVNWISGFGKMLYFLLLIIWPVTLLRFFYSASGEVSKTTMVALITVTLVYWIMFFIWSVYHDAIQLFLHDTFIPWITI